MDYGLIVNIINIVGGVIGIIMLFFSSFYIFSLFVSAKKVPPVPHSDKKTKFAVIVPAREESKVIDHIMLSLKRQTYDPEYFDVWFITEREDDPTNRIATKFGFNYFVRKDLVNKRRKGYAIQELDNYFRANNIKYDAYMIFDADNLLSPNYIEIMNDLRQTGVQVGLGYRNYTNASRNWLTCTSACYFSYMMTFTARMRTVLFKKSTICGTGFFIDCKVLDEAGGWIFTGMTEDTHLTTYCYYHNVNMRYYPLVDYYDEMCSTVKDSHKQKLRWIWGYFESRKYVKTAGEGIDYHAVSEKRLKAAKLEYKTSLFPFAIYTVIAFLICVISLVFAVLAWFAKDPAAGTLIGYSFIQLGILYGIFVVVAAAVIIKDNKHLKFNMPTIIWTMLTYAFFFLGILWAIVDGLFSKKKRSTWEPIDHTGELTNKEAEDINEKS